MKRLASMARDRRDESRDFLSQHVRLCLKFNDGVLVYTVHGIKPRRGPHQDNDSSFDWNFEETGEDKRKPRVEKVGQV